jgi:hypothetical protein
MIIDLRWGFPEEREAPGLQNASFVLVNRFQFTEIISPSGKSGYGGNPVSWYTFRSIVVDLYPYGG